MYPIAALYTAQLTQTMLRKANPGDKQRISLEGRLPAAIISMINGSHIYAGIRSRNQHLELVQIDKSSYRTDGNSIVIIRGVSPYANNAFEMPVDFSSPQQLYLDFSTIAPFTLANQNSENQPQVYVNSATDKAGLIGVAYKGSNLSASDMQKAVTIDTPALIKLYSLIYNDPKVVNTQLLDDAAIIRADTIKELFDFITTGDDNIFLLKELITLVKDQEKLNKLKSLLEE